MQVNDFNQIISSKEVELLPCPFCGGKPGIANALKVIINCWDCDASVSHKNPDEAIAKWENRKYKPRLITELL